MGDMMSFPNTIDEFLDDYSFKDKEEVYTNGSMLIPTFRVKQGIEHHARELNNVINRQAAEIIRLKGSVVTNNIMEIARIKKQAKSEAVKEFAERLKEINSTMDKRIIPVERIDDLVREMTEGV